MIWLTWRQHRKQLLFAVVGLAVLVAVLMPTGRQMRRGFVETGFAECLRRLDGQEFVPLPPGVGVQAGCDAVAGEFTNRYGSLMWLAVLFVFLPLLVGLFYGAPLVSREIEHGTHRLVWTQGVSRARWAVVKFGLVGAGGLVVAVGYALLLSWWIAPLGHTEPGRFFWIIFDAHGVVPVGYTVFAVALGIFAGTVKHKVLPAMALTLVGFLGVRVAVALLARPRFLPPRERRYSVDTDKVVNELRGDWVLGPGGFGQGANYDAAGNFHDVGTSISICTGDPAPSASAVPSAPPSRIPCANAGYNLQIYHPAERFWVFQYIETGLFLALAALLLFLAVHRVRRRIG